MSYLSYCCHNLCRICQVVLNERCEPDSSEVCTGAGNMDSEDFKRFQKGQLTFSENVREGS